MHKTVYMAGGIMPEAVYTVGKVMPEAAYTAGEVMPGAAYIKRAGDGVYPGLSWKMLISSALPAS